MSYGKPRSMKRKLGQKVGGGIELKLSFDGKQHETPCGSPSPRAFKVDGAHQHIKNKKLQVTVISSHQRRPINPPPLPPSTRGCSHANFARKLQMRTDGRCFGPIINALSGLQDPSMSVTSFLDVFLTVLKYATIYHNTLHTSNTIMK